MALNGKSIQQCESYILKILNRLNFFNRRRPSPVMFYRDRRFQTAKGITSRGNGASVCLVYGVWCLVFGVWCLVFGVWGGQKRSAPNTKPQTANTIQQKPKNRLNFTHFPLLLQRPTKKRPISFLFHLFSSVFHDCYAYPAL